MGGGCSLGCGSGKGSRSDVALLNNFLLFYKELSGYTQVIHRLITYYTQINHILHTGYTQDS